MRDLDGDGIPELAVGNPRAITRADEQDERGTLWLLFLTQSPMNYLLNYL